MDFSILWIFNFSQFSLSIFAVLIVVAVAIGFGSAYEICKPGESGTFHRDYSSCRGYIVCNNGKGHPGTCKGNYLFNEVTRSCDFPYNVKCTLVCPKTGITAFRLPQSCWQYVSCAHGKATRKECPAGYLFDTRSKKCELMQKADCPNKDTHCPDPRVNSKFPSKQKCSAWVQQIAKYLILFTKIFQNNLSAVTMNASMANRNWKIAQMVYTSIQRRAAVTFQVSPNVQSSPTKRNISTISKSNVQQPERISILIRWIVTCITSVTMACWRKWCADRICIMTWKVNDANWRNGPVACSTHSISTSLIPGPIRSRRTAHEWSIPHGMKLHRLHLELMHSIWCHYSEEKVLNIVDVENKKLK